MLEMTRNYSSAAQPDSPFLSGRFVIANGYLDNNTWVPK